MLSTTNSISSSSSSTVTFFFGSKLSPTVKVWSVTPFITGALFAFTLNVIVLTVVLLRLSIAVYVIVYWVSSSGSKLSSSFDVTLTSTEFPLISTALTPAIKSKASPAFMLTSLSSFPSLVMVGPWTTALTLTCTFKVSDLPPKLSVAVIYKS